MSKKGSNPMPPVGAVKPEPPPAPPSKNSFDEFYEMAGVHISKCIGRDFVVNDETVSKVASEISKVFVHDNG